MEKKTFTNYSNMLGMTDSYSDEKLNSIIKEYEDEEKKAYDHIIRFKDSYSFFKKNVEGLKYMKFERRRIKTANEFELKKEHLQLLEITNFAINEQGYMFCTFPTENKINEALNIKSFDQDGERFEEVNLVVDKLFDELPHAIDRLIKDKLENLTK